MAIAALVGRCVKFMAEVPNNGAFAVFEGHFSRNFEAGVALGTIALNREGGLSFMANSTGLRLFHLGHADSPVFLSVRLDQTRVTLFTTVGLGMESMTEGGPGDWWSVVGQFRTAVAFTALVDSKGLFAVVA